jgi:hypothetical protein
MRPAPFALGLLALAAAAAATAEGDGACPLPVLGAAVARTDAPRVALEADRRLGWALASIEALRDELRHADFSDSPRTGRQRNELVGAVVRMGALPWLQTKRAACECAAGPSAPPVCATLEADGERLRASLPRVHLRRPPDVDRLTKGR